MLTSEQKHLLQRHVSIDGDGNVVGNDNAVRVTKQAAGDYAVQIGQQRIVVTIEELRRTLTVKDSQVSVIGDHTHVEGGIHYNVYQYARPQPVDDATLATAQEQLAALPLDHVPPPAPLPPGSRMPFSRNPLFVGREADLRALAAALKGERTRAIGLVPTGKTAAVTGMGGAGKTQVASEFVHRYGQFFAGGVFWLSFGDPQAVPAEIAACGGAGALDLRPDFGSLPLADQVRLVLSAWQSPLPRLLVFDNCEDEELLAQWRPPSGEARVLVTSRRGEWHAALGVRVLRLDVLSRPNSVALLRQHRPDLADPSTDSGQSTWADTISEELGDLPLALHLAGSYLATYRHARFGAPDTYLAQLRQAGLDHPSLAEKGRTLTTAHERHVDRTFALSYERLDLQDPTDAVALALLACSAHFAPGEPIPRPLLLATLDLPGEDKDFEAERRAEDGLARLVALGLLDAGAEGNPVLHQLLAAFIRQVAADAAIDDQAQAAVERTLLAEANRLNEAGYPAPLLAWQPHLRAVTDAAQTRDDEWATRLCDALGVHLQMIGDYPAARPYLERALVISKASLGPHHPHTTTCLNNLAGLLRDMGDLAGARSYLEQALVINEAALGPHHPQTALSLNNLGNLLQDMGDLAGARSYYERALTINEAALGPDHPDTALNLNNLGSLLQAMGDLAGARPYFERALTINEAALGLDHPHTALNLNNLGCLLQEMGDLAGARPYYERALAIREKILGPHHPYTAQSLNNLGMLLQNMGNLAGARPYLERALAINETALGLDHPHTARNLNNLGYLLQAMGDLAGAQPYYERVLAIREKTVGPHHPDTAQSLNNLGMLLQEMGDLAGAQPYLERALAIREKIPEPNHPHTVQSLNNLGMLLQEMGDLTEARPYLERALAIREKALGLDHSDTAQSLNNLGILLEEMGDLARARSYLERALEICEKVLPDGDPRIKTVKGNLLSLQLEEMLGKDKLDAWLRKLQNE
jgi:tetratricopeptide (TPR) repeat protein